MKQASSSRIKQVLDDLERELFEIRSQFQNPCNSNLHQNYIRLEFGIARLERMHHTSEEYQSNIINLHSQFLNTCNEIFGFYPDRDEKL